MAEAREGQERPPRETRRVSLRSQEKSGQRPQAVHRNTGPREGVGRRQGDCVAGAGAGEAGVTLGQKQGGGRCPQGAGFLS